MLSQNMDVKTAPSPAVPRSLVAKTIEQRSHRRRKVAMDLWLTDLSGDLVLRCQCRNVSAGGLYATATVGYGLAVGQRYELRLSPGTGKSGSLLLGDSLGYATLIRTHMRAEGDPNLIGVAARFDAVQYLPG